MSMKALVKRMFRETYIPKLNATYQRWLSDSYDTESGTNVASYSSISISVYITEVKQRGVPTTYVTTAITAEDVGYPSTNDKLIIAGYNGSVTTTFAVVTAQKDSLGALTSITLQKEGIL